MAMTVQEITNLFLYGQTTRPADLTDDSLLRPVTNPAAPPLVARATMYRLSHVVLLSLVFSGCATNPDIRECRTSARDQGLVELRGEDETALLAQLNAAIEAASAMKPTFARPYKQLTFHSDAKAMLCQVGPCLPTKWLFELRSGRWELANRPEGLCVSQTH